MFEDTMFTVQKSQVNAVLRQDDHAKYEINRLVHQGILAPIPGHVGIVREDTKQVLSVMSKDYFPLTDMLILQHALELFEASGIQVRPIAHHIYKGKDGVLGRTTHMEVEVTNPAYTIFAGTDEEQRIRIVIPNSFNGTLCLEFILMLFKLLCSNGSRGWVRDFSIKIKHRQGADQKMVDALNLYMGRGITTAIEKIEELQTKVADTDRLISYLQNNKVLSGQRWAEKLMGAWLIANEPTSFWNVYNIFTAQITHVWGRNFSSKITKYNVLNKEVVHEWDRLLSPERVIIPIN